MRPLDLTGETFGSLTVLGPAVAARRSWSVRCTCGATKRVRVDHLRSGRVVSCGCHRASASASRTEDLTGLTVGRLTVTGRAGSSRDGQATWHTRCVCGGTSIVRAGDLRTAATRSCGCLNRERVTAPTRKAVVTYAGAHSRVRRQRGPAAHHPCVDCGAPAEHWSYDHGDANELVGEVRGYALPYSLDAQHYDPRCQACHNRFDHPTEVTA